MGSRTFYGLLGALLALAIIIIAVGAMLNRTTGDQTFSNAELAQQTATAIAKSTLAVTLPAETPEPTATSSAASSPSLLMPYENLNLLGSHSMSSKLTFSNPITTTTITTLWETNVETNLRRVVVTVSETSAADTLTTVSETIYSDDMAFQRQDDGSWMTRTASQAELDSYAADWLGGYGDELLNCPITLAGRETIDDMQVNRYVVNPDCLEALEAGASLSTVEASLWATASEDLIIQAAVYLDGVDSEGQSFTYSIEASIQGIGVNPSITLPEF